MSLTEDIVAIAESSRIASFNWPDRGLAPAGYTNGIALAWAWALQKYQAGDPAAVEMAKANTGNADKDALSWYRGIFDDLGMPNQKAGIDTLRHVFVFLMGLGMRESSGRHCEGRDQSASNTSADTAEAGLFQTSWNFHSCSSQVQRLTDMFEEPSDEPDYLDEFKEGVSCSSSEWSCYGSPSSAGYHFQELCKHNPNYACQSTAVGLRNIRQHWGPIGRYEVDVVPYADTMLHDVQNLVMAVEPEPIPPEPLPPPTITITVSPAGSARVLVKGSA